MDAQHGADCAPFPASHRIPYGTNIDQNFFVCHDHLMTALNARDDQGVAAITPNALVDFSSGASIQMPISTLRTSGRDWLEFWITPFAEQQAIPQTPFTGDEFQGPPKDAILLQMGNPAGDTAIIVFVCKNFHCDQVGANSRTFAEALAAHGLKPDASRRDTYQIDIRQSHITFSFPQYGETLLDMNIPALPFTQGLFQLIQRSYHPQLTDICATNDVAPTCTPNTWHIGGISIDHAIPFTLLKGDERVVGANSPVDTFPSPAPQNTMLRFIGLGDVQVSFDDGKTYQKPQKSVEDPAQSGRVEHYENYFTPVPTGVRRVMFKGTNTYFGPWEARNPILMSLAASSTSSTLASNHSRC
jgi:hypothetical protein